MIVFLTVASDLFNLCCLTAMTGFGEECTLDNISSFQLMTGKLIQGQIEWQTVIVNGCKCPQANLIFKCDGFESVEAVDPRRMAKNGDQCLINSGLAIPGFSLYSFVYAWDKSYPFIPLSSQVICSS